MFSRNASKCIQVYLFQRPKCIYFIVFLDGVCHCHFCLRFPMILHPQASTKGFQEKIQEGLDISPNIAANHLLHCGSFSEIAC
jgi:hypothetical protein